jgi:hypothetical protein
MFVIILNMNGYQILDYPPRSQYPGIFLPGAKAPIRADLDRSEGLVSRSNSDVY